jgi:hypothetical protein
LLDVNNGTGLSISSRGAALTISNVQAFDAAASGVMQTEHPPEEIF